MRGVKGKLPTINNGISVEGERRSPDGQLMIGGALEVAGGGLHNNKWSLLDNGVWAMDSAQHNRHCQMSWTPAIYPFREGLPTPVTLTTAQTVEGENKEQKEKKNAIG